VKHRGRKNFPTSPIAFYMPQAFGSSGIEAEPLRRASPGGARERVVEQAQNSRSICTYLRGFVLSESCESTLQR
jgi:hypothetical protein